MHYNQINSLYNYWTNRKLNDPIPNEYKVSGKSLKKLISDFVKDLGEFNESKQTYTYKVNGRPITSRKTKFAYPMSYPSIGIKDFSYSKKPRVKSIVYNPQSDELVFVFPSIKSIPNTAIAFEDLVPQLQVVGREYGKYIELIEFMRDVMYNHKVPQGFYVHVHGVDNTPDEIMLIK